MVPKDVGVSGDAPAVTTTATSTEAIKPASAVPASLEGPASRPSSRASMKRVTSHITPAIPLRPATPIRAVTPVATPRLASAKVATPTVTPNAERKEKVELETPTKAPKASGLKEQIQPAQTEVKVGLGEGSATAGAEKGVAPPSATSSDTVAPPRTAVGATASAAVPQTQKPDQPYVPAQATASTTVAPQTKAEPTAAPAQKSVPKAMQPTAKGSATVQSSSAEAVPVTPSKAEPAKGEPQQKRKPPPGKLDISAAVKEDAQTTSAKKQAETPGQAKAAAQSSATSKVESPSVASPAVKAAPKTLRVVATPKSETPPAGVTTPKDPAPAVPPTPKDATSAVPSVPAKVASRRPSVASINPPGTPSSAVEDSMSIASTSQSRANSPPPGSMAGSSKVGSAPVKAKTKNQLKKERRGKVIEEEKEKVEDVGKAVPEEPAQEAIVSRKKKTKKEKEPKPPKVKAAPIVETAGTTNTGESTPTASRPVTPQQVATPPAAPKPEPVTKEVKTSKPSTPTRPAVSTPLTMPSPGEPSPPPTPTLSAAQLIAELRATAPDIQKCIDSLFRSPAGNHYKPNQPITNKDLASYQKDFKLDLTQAEVRALLSGSVPAVRYGGADGRIWDRGLVSPTGAHLRALTQELETRFLELEKAIHELPEELRFRPSKPQNDTQFPAIDLEGLKRQFENFGGRGVSVMEQMVREGSGMKKGAFLVDEASRYINEFVMPPVTPPPNNAVPATGGAAMGGAGTPVTMGASIPMRSGPLKSAVLEAQDADGNIVPLPEFSGEGGVTEKGMLYLEQGLGSSRREEVEREGGLRKVMKRNRKVLGLS